MDKPTQIDRFCPVGIGGTKNLDTTHLKLFIGNLPESCGSQQLYDALISYGPIREAVVIPDRFRVRSRRYGFVTFVDQHATNRVLNSQPFKIADRTLTVVLACTNAKPRRAHFLVRHGTSGHKLLPSNESFISDNTDSINAYDDLASEYSADTTATNKPSPIVYSDPSLFRTANIQQISPACMDIPQVNCNPHKDFPNEDIERDFERLLRLRKSTSNNNFDDRSCNSNDYSQSCNDDTDKRWRRKLAADVNSHSTRKSISTSDSFTALSNKRSRNAETYLASNSPLHSPAKKSRFDMDINEMDVYTQNSPKNSNNGEDEVQFLPSSLDNLEILSKSDGIEKKILGVKPNEQESQLSNEQLHASVRHIDPNETLQYGPLDTSYPHLNGSESQWTYLSSIPNTIYPYYGVPTVVGVSSPNMMTQNCYQINPMLISFAPTTSDQMPISIPQSLLDENIRYTNMQF